MQIVLVPFAEVEVKYVSVSEISDFTPNTMEVKEIMYLVFTTFEKIKFKKFNSNTNFPKNNVPVLWIIYRTYFMGTIY